MKRAWALLAVAALTASAGLSGAAIAQPEGIQITPVIIDIPPDRGVTSFRLHNWRAEEAAFESSVFVWSQKDGQDILTPTKDLLIAPSVFAIAAGKEQIVRLALPADARAAGTEKSYRLILRELPSSQPVEGLRMQLQISLPVFAAPKNAAPNLKLRKHASGAGAAIILTNSGNSRIRLISASSEGSAITQDLPLYLLSGASAELPPETSSRPIVVQYLAQASDTPVSQKLSIDGAAASAGVR
ncbi:MAG: fimbria/pilus periplasmic chaperone [Caulobacterales bacterium]